MKPLSRNKAAQRIGIAPATLASYERRGIAPAHTRLHGKVLYSVEAIDSWLAARTGGVA
jgi:hypothetical protein